MLLQDLLGGGAPQQQPPVEQPRQLNEHKGLFGLKGTARNVLGTIGDALLINSGAPPLFRQQVQREEQEDALADYNTDPEGAINRLAKVNPDAAAKMRANLFKQRKAEYDQQVKTEEIAYERQQDSLFNGIKQEEAARDAKKFEAEQFVRNRGIAGQILTTANAQNYSQIKDRIANIFKERGEDLPVNLPDTYDKTTIDALIRSSIDVEDNLRIAQRETQDERTFRLRQQEAGVRATESASRNTDRDDRRTIQRENRQSRENSAAYQGRSRRTTRNGSAPSSRYVRQNGILFDRETGRPVN